MAASKSLTEGLNPAQKDAVSTLSGPLLVLAGAGTGKTRVVTVRIANLIRNGTAPERILGVTFTNKAALEMKERITGILGKGKNRKKPEVSTFHSLCVKVLRRWIDQLGYPKHYVILDRGEQESIARSVLREIKVQDGTVKPSELLWKISSWKSKSVRPPQAASMAETDKEHLCAMAYRRYQRQIKTRGAVDFDDLLLLTEELLTQNEQVRAAEAGRFDHILIDEYQDTNESQYQIVRSLAEEHRNLCVVGDDDQSIYAWRGAEVQHILNFEKDWPDAKVVRLEENYRSTGNILRLANQLISYNQTRFDKELKPARPSGSDPPIYQFSNETQEAQEVVARIRQRLSTPGVDPSDIAILFRTNEQPRPFEIELRKAKIPYVVLGSQSFFDRKEVRDITSYMKVAAFGHDDTSLLRIINLPPRGIGHTLIERIMAAAIEQEQSVWSTIESIDDLANIRTAGREAIKRFVGTIKRFRDELKSKPVEALRNLISDVNYRAELQRNYSTVEEQDVKMNIVEEVVNAFGAYLDQNPKAGPVEFLQDAVLDEPEFDNDKEKKLNRNAIALLTLHSAKGLEYPEVYMVGLEEGILPHRRSVEDDGEAIDEERRLCYVGITRAQERLTLSLCLTRMKWGKPREAHPSRFLYEMIGEADKPQDQRRKRRR